MKHENMTHPQKPTGHLQPHECEGLAFKQIQQWNELKIKELNSRVEKLEKETKQLATYTETRR